jgi:hypothetical protein
VTIGRHQQTINHDIANVVTLTFNGGVITGLVLAVLAVIAAGRLSTLFCTIQSTESKTKTKNQSNTSPRRNNTQTYVVPDDLSTNSA